MTAAALERDAALADLTVLAETLADPRLWELATYAIRVRDDKPPARPEYDDDAVWPVLKDYWGLSREDRRRFKVLVATIDRKTASP